MFNSIARFVWRITKCVIGAVALTVGGYYLCWGLNWLTDKIMNFLMKAAMFLSGNYVAVIWVIVALIIGGIAFELVSDGFRGWASDKAAKKAQKKAQKKGDHQA